LAAATIVAEIVYLSIIRKRTWLALQRVDAAEGVRDGGKSRNRMPDVQREPWWFDMRGVTQGCSDNYQVK